MIYLPEKYGLCAGGTKALNLVLETINKTSEKRVVLYKEILHNPYIIDKYQSMGCVCITDFDELKKDDIVIVRAHGETKDFFDQINNLGIECVDATCPNVKLVEKKIEEAYLSGHKIIIIGKKNHPEVISSNGWCNNEAVIISNLEEAEAYSYEPGNIYDVFEQTTFNLHLVEKISEILKNNCCNSNIYVHNTLCNAQNNLHKETLKLLDKVDVLFIIGGKNSSNTLSLYEKCVKQSNVFCYHLASLDEFTNFIHTNKQVLEYNNYGIAGGASTTSEEIQACKLILENVLQEK